MATYNVQFITSTGELIKRTFPADNMQACLNLSVAHFSTLNADHGELFEVVVLPPDGEPFLDGDPQALEFYWLTPAGRTANRAAYDNVMQGRK
jgi:hypothetical protein